MFNTMYLETTTACNLHCNMCPRFTGSDISLTPAVMPTEVFQNASTCFSRLTNLALVGFGEPTTDKRLLEFVSIANRAGVYTMFTTNGLLLTPSFSEEVFNSGLKLMGVSVDAAAPERYAEIRNGASLEQVTENLRRFIRMRRERGNRPVVKVQTVLMQSNIDELPRIVELAADIEADEVYAKNLCALRTQFLIDESLQVEFNPAVDIEKRNRVLDFALEMACRHGIRLIVPSYKKSVEIDCPYHPMSTVFIRRSGDVFPCPVFADWSTDGQEEVIKDKYMGNVLRENLESIWVSERYCNFRARFSEGKEGLCTECSVWRQSYRGYSPRPISGYTY